MISYANLNKWKISCVIPLCKNINPHTHPNWRGGLIFFNVHHALQKLWCKFIITQYQTWKTTVYFNCFDILNTLRKNLRGGTQTKMTLRKDTKNYLT